jgi:hypothetical protein
MGYTHYWYKEKELSENNWKTFIAEIEVLFKGNTLLCSEYDKPDSLPIADDELVRFNGKDEDGHETFYFPRVESGQTEDDGKRFSFCKTAYKPYDSYVVRALMLAEEHFGKGIRVESDGDWDTVKVNASKES